MSTKKVMKSSVIPPSVRVEAGGKQFTITIFDTEQTFGLLEPFFEVFEQLQASGVEMTPTRLIGKCPKAVIAMLATAIGEPDEFIKRLPPNETLRLLSALLETNMPFFTDHVRPEFERVVTMTMLPAARPANH